MHCYWESGYAPWIDVLLVFHAYGGASEAPVTTHGDAPHEAIPRDIALYTAGIYIALITPLIACHDLRMYMYAEGTIFKWHADAEVINPNSFRVLRVKPIDHLKCVGTIDHVTKIACGCEFGIGITVLATCTVAKGQHGEVCVNSSIVKHTTIRPRSYLFAKIRRVSLMLHAVEHTQCYWYLTQWEGPRRSDLAQIYGDNWVSWTTPIVSQTPGWWMSRILLRLLAEMTIH
jgi:hypothetical protein